MNAIILAAGFGTRLKEFGKTTPKGLIPQGKSTLLAHVVEDLSDITPSPTKVLVTNDVFFETYSDWVSSNFKDAQIHILNDGAKNPDVRKGALGDIVFAVNELAWWEDNLLVLPSDTYYEFSLAQFITFAQNRTGFSTVVRDLGDKALIANRLGCAVIAGDRITAFVEKPADPPSTFAAIPFYYYPKEVLRLLPDYEKSGGNMDAPGSIVPWLLSSKINVFAYKTTGTTLDVGTLADVDALATVSG